MKPTHILVPIEEWEAGHYIYSVHNPDVLIEVNLSEEWSFDELKKKALKDDITRLLTKAELEYMEGYQQCAKDLLNTKP